MFLVMFSITCGVFLSFITVVSPITKRFQDLCHVYRSNLGMSGVLVMHTLSFYMLLTACHYNLQKKF